MLSSFYQTFFPIKKSKQRHTTLFASPVDMHRIKNNPNLLLVPDKNGLTPLHRALKEDREDNLEAILLMVSQNQKLKDVVLTAKDKAGWSCLHYAAKFSSLSMVKMLVSALGKRAHELAVLVTDDMGKLPLLLSRSNPHQEYKQIKRLIKDITIEKTHEDLQQAIKFQDSIENNQYPSYDEAILRNIHYGCIAANHVRKMIARAPTHTNSNTLDHATYLAYWDECNNLRDDYKAPYGDIDDQDSEATLLKKMAIIETHVKKHQLGNCGEYADLVAFCLAKMGINENHEVFNIANGDHVFNVIGRDPKSPMNDFKKWGPNAVVVDAWAGKVYPASQIPLQLRAYKTYFNTFKTNRRGGLTYTFNQKYHILEKHYGFYQQQKTKPSINYTEFSPSEMDDIQRNELQIKHLLEPAKKRMKLQSLT